VNQIESIEASIGSVPVDEIAWRLHRLSEDAETLLKNVKASEDIRQIEQELRSTVINLPTKAPYPKDHKPRQQAIVAYNEALARLRKRYGGGSKKKP
jgi:hypothetical protein